MEKKAWSLKLIVVLVIGISLLVFSILILFIVNTTMPRMLIQSENSYQERQLEVTTGLFDAAMKNTYRMADDIGIWDQSVLFVRGEYPHFISDNWPDTSLLQNYSFNFVIFKNLEGQTIYIDFFDFIENESLPIPQGFSRELDKISREVLEIYETPQSSGRPLEELGRGGIFFFQGVPYGIAAMPIMTSREDSPAGTVILGSILNNEYFQRLTHLSTVDFELLPQDLTAEAAGGGPSGSAGIMRQDEVLILTSANLMDINGNPVLLRMMDNREIYAQGQKILMNTTLMLLFVMALLIAAIYTIIVRLVLKPISQLSQEIGGLSARDFLDTRKFAWSTEFSSLCSSINDMLSMLNQSNISVNVFQSIFNGMDAYLWVSDFENDEILFMNNKMREHFGLNESIIGRICWKVIQRNQKERCSFCPKYKLTADPGAAVVWEEQNPVTGRYYRNTDVLIKWLDDRTVQLQHRIDITDIKNTEDILKRRLEQQELMSEMSQNFISDQDISTLVHKAIEMAGKFMDVSKILLVRYEQKLQALITEYEWYNEKQDGFRPGNLAIPFLPGTVEYDGFIANEKPYLAFTDISIIPYFAEAASHGIKSVIGTPLYVSGDFWGMISFNECEKTREWTSSDVQLVTLISNVISGALTRSMTGEKLVRMSSIVNSSPQFVAYINTDGQFEYFNQGALNHLGYTREEMTKGGFGFTMEPETYDKLIREIVPQVLRDGKSRFELPLIRKDGQTRIMSFSAFRTNFKSPGIGVIALDVTEEREMEKELISAKELAEASSRSKGEFLSRMSHEMRTPMNAIIGMTSIAKNSDDPEKKESCLEKIEEASTHLLGVINDILDMSKIEAGKFDLSYIEFNFERMFMRIIDVVNFRIDEKRQTLLVQIDPQLPHFIIADEQRLSQVITNLLSNAVKFTPEEGTITLAARQLHEKEGVCTIRVEVLDTGIGIPKEQQENLFHSFEQADGGISRKFGGTGLGLAISKSIIELMGGEIGLESEAGGGARFFFEVTVQKGSRTHKSQLDPKINWKNLRILAVDDAPEVREYFEYLAGSLEIVCAAAADGQEACRILEENQDSQFNIVFVDYYMPGMNGIELTRKIKERFGPDMVVVMISAAEWDTLKKEAREAGVDGFIPKPLFSSLIVNCITEYLGADKTPGLEPGEPRDYGGILNGVRILLAEDIEINREIVITLLEETGVVIDTAENGREALEKFSRDPGAFDIIFMDIHMPELDGFQATREIRSMDTPEAKSIPIIAMTANVFREDIEQCLAAGMNDHIGKPIDVDDIISKLKKHLPAK